MLRSTPLLGTRRRSATAAILGGRLLATAAPPSASSSSARPAPLKLAIIGAGPSGLYAASRILAQLPAEDDRSQVHVYERLPAPHGLVRYGVAPDHPEVKNVQHKFDLLANDPRFSFFGNVAVGPSSPPKLAAAASSPAAYPYPAAVRLPLESLLPHYSHVLLSYGSSLSAPLPHTPGASSSAKPLANVYPALAFVSWYNGHPAFADLAVDLSTVKHVTVIGQGNVALDCARLLVKDVDALATSDLPEHVLDVLRRSAVETVEVVGRRGPAQVAFTTKEFREMLALEDVRFEGPGEAELAEALAEVARVGGSEERMRKRLLGLMAKGSSSSSTTTSKPSKTFKLSFLRSPKAFLPTSDDAVAGAEGRPPPPAVKSIRWALNGLLPTPTHAPTLAASATAGDPPNTPAPSNPVSTAVPTGVELETATDMVIESVGYRSEPLVLQSTAAAAKGDERPEQEAAVWPEGWFDDRRGRVRNVGGRVVSADGEIVPNVYASGWLARGPIGVIAQTMYDSYSVADLLLSDRQATTSSTLSPTLTSIGGGGGRGGGRATGVHDGLPRELLAAAKEGRVLDWLSWKRVEAAEEAEGVRKGKRAEKFVREEQMLAVGRSGPGVAQREEGGRGR